MNIREFIRESIINVVEESKDHLIRKIPNLSEQQKTEIIEHFKQFPHKESDPRLDWNRLNTLNYEVFQSVMQESSKTKLKRDVSLYGIDGITKGRDYLEMTDYEAGTFSSGSLIGVYLPLTYEASKLLASDKIGSCTGEWCTAYQKSDDYWVDYVYNKGGVLVYLMFTNTKYAVYVENDGGFTPYSLEYLVFDATDREIVNKKIPNINLAKILNDNIEVIIEANKIHSNSVPLSTKYGFSSNTEYNMNDDGSIDVFGDVTIKEYMLVNGEITIKYNFAHNFKCNMIALKSLKNSPTYCTGLNVSGSSIETLEGGPEKCEILSVAYSKKLKSLEGAPKNLITFRGAECKSLKSLNGLPKTVTTCIVSGSGVEEIGTSLPNLLDLDVYASKISSIQGLPKVMNELNISSNNTLSSLKGFPGTINDDLYLNDMSLKSLKYFPTIVKGSVYILSSGIKDVDEFPPCNIEGSLYVSLDDIRDNILRYLPEGVNKVHGLTMIALGGMIKEYLADRDVFVRNVIVKS